MMVPSSFIRYSFPVRALAGFRGMRGLGYDEMLLSNPGNACAPGLTLINGSCFRAPGSQSTPYGTVAMPVAGPDSNNDIAERLLGNGASCEKERVSNGPYTYEQNICRDRQGNVISGADNLAETAWVQASLSNPQNPQIFGSSSTNAPASQSPTQSSSNPAGGNNASGQAGRGGNGSGNQAAQRQQPNQSPETVQGREETSGKDSGERVADVEGGDNTLLILGAVAVGVFLLMKGGK